MQYTYKSHPKEYRIWTQIKQRCSNPSIWKKYPRYEGCVIDSQWDDFHQFVIDYHSMVGYGLPKRHIDKDIIIKGNQIYGPDTCILVPEQINTLLTSSHGSRGKYPLGVSYEDGRFIAKIRIHNRRKYLGCYPTMEDAFQAYKIAKEQHIKDMANYYKHELDPRAYTALMNWTISEND